MDKLAVLALALALAWPMAHLILQAAVAGFLFHAWRSTAMRGWLVLAVSWAVGVAGSAGGVYGAYLVRNVGPSDYGRWMKWWMWPQAAIGLATTVLTVAGLVILVAECRRLVGRPR